MASYKQVRKTLILLALLVILALAPCRSASCETVNRYATQRIGLRDSAGGKVLKKIKRSTKVRQIRAGKKWSKVKYKGEVYYARKKYLSSEKLPSKKKSRYYINYLKTKGPVKWHGRKYTYYTSRLCPIWLLPVKGLHTDKDGFWIDSKGYIVLGSSIPLKKQRAIVATPFGKYGKVYDTGGWSTPSWLCDVATSW